MAANKKQTGSSEILLLSVILFYVQACEIQVRKSFLQVNFKTGTKFFIRNQVFAYNRGFGAIDFGVHFCAATDAGLNGQNWNITKAYT